MQHNWRTLVSSNDPKFWVKGTEIECSIPSGYLSRFAIYSVRTVARGANCIEHDCRYRVRDAAMAAGLSAAPIAAEFATLEQAEQYINNQWEG